MPKYKKPTLVLEQVNEGIKTKLYPYPKQPKAIGGHRFVTLLGKNKYKNNDLAKQLDLFDLYPFVENVYTILGKKFESEVLAKIKTIYGGVFKTFSYKDYKGDMFPDVKNFNGLIDAISNDDVIYEIKTFYSKYKILWKNKKPQLPQEWKLQLQLYLYLYKKQFPKAFIKKGVVFANFINITKHNITFKNAYDLDKIKEIKNNNDIKLDKQYFKWNVSYKNITNLINQVIKERKRLITFSNDGYVKAIVAYNSDFKTLIFNLRKHLKNDLDINWKGTKLC